MFWQVFLAGSGVSPGCAVQDYTAVHTFTTSSPSALTHRQEGSRGGEGRGKLLQPPDGSSDSSLPSEP